LSKGVWAGLLVGAGVLGVFWVLADKAVVPGGTPAENRLRIADKQGKAAIYGAVAGVAVWLVNR
jgi:hypothetical protein